MGNGAFESQKSTRGRFKTGHFRTREGLANADVLRSGWMVDHAIAKTVSYTMVLEADLMICQVWRLDRMKTVGSVGAVIR